MSNDNKWASNTAFVLAIIEPAVGLINKATAILCLIRW